MSSLRLLFSPITLGPVTVPNRIVSSAHTTNLSPDGFANQKHVHYYAARARGGIGLLVMEAVRVHPTTAPPRSLIGYDRSALPGLQKVTEAVHAYNTKIFAQILHMGRQMNSVETGLPLWAPSALPCPTKKEIPHPMEPEEITEVIESYGRTAALMAEAGFDGVEIHAAHGYLIQQFLSPYTNHRIDEYGGSFENRMRFLLEVVRCVREALGGRLALGIRISAEEFTDEGLDLEEMKKVAVRLEETGLLDYISVSQCNYNGLSYSTMIPDMHFPPGAFVYLAAGIRAVLKDLPVMAVGRITDPVQAEQILSDGHADLVCMTRATICDPELPNKARRGDFDEIRSCVGCNQGCAGRIHRGLSVRCLQNPEAGREFELQADTVQRGVNPKKIVVVGGGPAGLEAARVAAVKGCRVILYEKRHEPGGQVILASQLPGRQEFRNVERNLTLALERLGVEMRLGVEASPEDILKEGPDAVIVATGSVPVIPEIPGSNGMTVGTVEDLLEGRLEPGERVVLLDDDGHFRATGTAEYVAEMDKEVIIVTPRAFVGGELPPTSWVTQEQRLRAAGVRVMAGYSAVRAEGSNLIIRDVFTGEENELAGVDTVLAAWWRVPAAALYGELKGQVPELYLAGDALAPRRALEAIADGYRVARLL